MIFKFRVDHIFTVNTQIYVSCIRITEDINCYMSDHSYLGDFPIENWIEMPRALDEEGKQRKDLYVLVLKNATDKDKLKLNEIYEMWDDYVDVIDSYDLSTGKMIAFLKCYPGKYEEVYVLEDSTLRRWVLKEYLVITGSVDTYEKIKTQEKENIFQYWIQPVGHNEKPEAGTRLKIYR